MSMNLPASMKELIDKAMRDNNNNISRVARILDVPYVDLFNAYKPKDPPVRVSATGPFPDDIRVLGKSGWQHYVIAAKRAGQPWPPKFDRALVRARELFDAGTHEMFQTTKDGWVVQYLYPRRRPTRPRRFFSTMTAPNDSYDLD